MRAALDIALKDLKQKVRDRSALLISIVAPFALAALFSLGPGRPRRGLPRRLGLRRSRWRRDRRPPSTTGPSPAWRKQVSSPSNALPRRGAARAAVESGEVETAIIVPEGFTASARAGAGSSVELIVDPDATISGQVARSVLAGFASQIDAVQLSVATALIAGGPAARRHDHRGAGRAGAVPWPTPSSSSTLPRPNRQAGYATYYAAAMAILFVFLAAQFGIVSIHAERRTRTLARMLAAPAALAVHPGRQGRWSRWCWRSSR